MEKVLCFTQNASVKSDDDCGRRRAPGVTAEGVEEPARPHQSTAPQETAPLTTSLQKALNRRSTERPQTEKAKRWKRTAGGADERTRQENREQLQILNILL